MSTGPADVSGSPVSGDVGSGAAVGVMTGDGVVAGNPYGDVAAVGLSGPEQETSVAIAGTAMTSAMMITVFRTAATDTRLSRIPRP